MKKAETMEDIQSFIHSHTIALLYISQPGCSVCQSLLPQIEELLTEYPNVKAVQADAAEIREVAGAFSVFTAPVVLVFVEGKEWFRRARFVPMGELHRELTKLNDLLNE